MERATSTDPSEIFLLQEFCKDEDEEMDATKKKRKFRRQGLKGNVGGGNELSGVRLLGRRSMDLRMEDPREDEQTTTQASDRDESITDDSQSIDSTMENDSILDDEKNQSFKVHKVLAKIRLSLDFGDENFDEKNKITKENLFDNLGDDLKSRFLYIF